jgi:cation transporter-like permease
MITIAKALTALAAIAFVLAVVSSFAGPILQTSAEAYSRACSNLALLAIALSVIFCDRTIVGRSAPLS